MASPSSSPPSEQSVITGVIIIPKRCFQAHPKITISLQDNSRIDRKSVEIASRSLHPTYITAGDKISFSLPYQSNDLLADTNEWYTLHIRITTLVEHQDDAGLSLEDELLVCFNNRVTRAIDDNGAPVQGLRIPLINARQELQQQFQTRQLPARQKSASKTLVGPVRRKSKIEAE